MNLELIPATVEVQARRADGSQAVIELVVSEIRDRFVFTESSGPWCLDDGAWCCSPEHEMRLTDASLAKCRKAVEESGIDIASWPHIPDLGSAHPEESERAP